jgi:hypothetical protein
MKCKITFDVETILEEGDDYFDEDVDRLLDSLKDVADGFPLRVTKWKAEKEAER